MADKVATNQTQQMAQMQQAVEALTAAVTRFQADSGTGKVQHPQQPVATGETIPVSVMTNILETVQRGSDAYSTVAGALDNLSVNFSRVSSITQGLVKTVDALIASNTQNLTKIEQLLADNANELDIQVVENLKTATQELTTSTNMIQQQLGTVGQTMTGVQLAVTELAVKDYNLLQVVGKVMEFDHATPEDVHRRSRAIVRFLDLVSNDGYAAAGIWLLKVVAGIRKNRVWFAFAGGALLVALAVTNGVSAWSIVKHILGWG